MAERQPGGKPLVEDLIRDAALRVEVTQRRARRMPHRLRRARPWGLEAGRRIAEICLGGLGRVSLETIDPDAPWPFMVTVHTSQPVIACLGSQYAGWSLSVEEKGKKYHVLGSGPARALGSSEKLFEELGYRDDADSAVSRARGRSRAAAGARRAGGQGLQAQARPPDLHLRADLEPRRHGADRRALLEVALHKAHELHFPLEHIVDGIATAPLPPPAPDFVERHGPHQRRHHLSAGGSSFSSRATPRPPRSSPRTLPASSPRITASRSPRSSPR